jgi:catechol 2,3-dioxygenase
LPRSWTAPRSFILSSEAEQARLEGLGVRVTTAEHAWVRWRSLYVDDPEGNTVEWVCYDESVG